MSNRINITEEDSKRIKKEYQDYVKLLSSEYQFGLFVGEYIYQQFLPSLSTEMILTPRNVIKVNDEDTKQNKLLGEKWFNHSINDIVERDKYWQEYYNHSKYLENKYLKPELECYLTLLNIRDEDEFKKGIIHTLWHSDVCSYSLKPEDIEISHDDYSTIIKFTKLGYE